MVIQMVNRMLGLVIAVTVSTTVAAHAMEDSLRHVSTPAVGVRLGASPFSLRPADAVPVAIRTGLPAVIQDAALTVVTRAQTVTTEAHTLLDPKAAVAAAYSRNHDALERLRAQAASLNGAQRQSALAAINADEQRLSTLQGQALDYATGDALTAGDEMDAVAAHTKAAVDSEGGRSVDGKDSSESRTSSEGQRYSEGSGSDASQRHEGSGGGD